MYGMEGLVTRYAKSGGINIAYQIVGDGPPDLLLVPGFVSHLEVDWDDPGHSHFLRRLAGFSRLIRFDKRGTGLSDRPGGLPDLETRMADVRVVMDAAESERAVLFGYSEGGPMSVLFAATYPDMISALVLYGAYAKRQDPDDDYPWAATREERERYAKQVEEDWGWEADMRRMCPGADQAMARWWATRARAAASPGAARDLVLMNSVTDIREILPTVKVPALVLHRTGDLDSNVEEGRYIAQRIPSARFVELSGSDHVPWIDADQVVDEIEEFVTGVRPAPQADRVLATVLFTDLVDSTKRAADLGDHRWRALLASQRLARHVRWAGAGRSLRVCDSGRRAPARARAPRRTAHGRDRARRRGRGRNCGAYRGARRFAGRRRRGARVEHGQGPRGGLGDPVRGAR